MRVCGLAGRRHSGGYTQTTQLAKAYRKKQAWSLDTYALVLSVHAHKESVLGLYLSEDGELLFSSGGDSAVNVLLATFLLSVSVRITLMPVGVVHQDL